jgi:serine/threonine protein kinase
MGEVYKARDIRLDRVVAIKVSKEQFSTRFEREARAIAALNHPSICTLHDVGPDYLVMEYIEGRSLTGPLPLGQALKYAIQICDALDAAHKKGITHRDLKPANILVAKTGVKLLDFGLAKISQEVKPVSDTTLTMALTGENQLVGTLYYMSPEQLSAQPNGREIDARSDIFSFGLVLYEMLTGKRAFEGSTPASVIAAIMERPAPSVATVAPAALDHVLQRCLHKDPDDRWQTARDLKAELEWIAGIPGERTTPSLKSRTRWPWIAALVFAVIGAMLTLALRGTLHPTPEAAKPVRFHVEPPPGVNIGSAFSLSPDGTKLAYVGYGADQVPRIFLRSMESLESRALAGTEHTSWLIIWSPDSRFIAFTEGGKLKKLDVAGGPPQTVCDVTVEVGGSWNSDGVILFGTGDGTGIHRVSAAGGLPTPITTLNVVRKDSNHMFPTFLPDGRHFLYIVQSAARENSGIYLGSLEAKPVGPEPKRLLAADVGLGFVALPGGKAGWILLQREGILLAHRFDLRRLATTGEPIPFGGQLGTAGIFPNFAASENGVLVFRALSGASKQLVWFDRQGKSLGAAGAPHTYAFMMRLSPDGSRVAATRIEAGNSDIWITSFSSGIDARFTFDPALDFDPAWSPDGKRIAFSSNRAGNSDLYQHASDGSGDDELLFRSDHRKVVTDWSQDGRFLLYHDSDPKTKRDIWVLPMDTPPGERKPTLLLRTEFDERDARFSPDSRWIAYMSDESGRNEIYVRPFPASGTGGKWMISQGGGLLAAWRRDGKELFYIGNDGSVMAVPVSAAGVGFQHGTPVALFKGPASPQGWDVSADGQKFLLAVPVARTAQEPFTVVLNWTSLLSPHNTDAH